MAANIASGNESPNEVGLNTITPINERGVICNDERHNPPDRLSLIESEFSISL